MRHIPRPIQQNSDLDREAEIQHSVYHHGPYIVVFEGGAIVYAEVILQKLHVTRLKHPVHGYVRPAGGGVKFGKGSMLLVCELGGGWEVALAHLIVRTHIEARHSVLHSHTPCLAQFPVLPRLG